MRLSLFVYALAAGLVTAQNIPPCVLSCSGPAAQAVGCPNSLDLKCVCDNQVSFTASVTPCILSTCSPQDQAAALGLQQSLCAASGAGGSSSMSSPVPTAAASSSAAASTVVVPTSTASAASTNGGGSSKPNGAVGGVRVWGSGWFAMLGAGVVFLAL